MTQEKHLWPAIIFSSNWIEASNVKETTDIEKPPLFQTWRSWYTLVILNLLAWCCLFYLVTVYFC